MKLVALGVLAFSLVASQARTQDGGIAVGAVAPNAALQTLDGKPVQLGTLL